MCNIISASVSPSSKVLNDICFRRMDMGMVASMRELRLSKPQVWAMLVSSSEVAELWRRGNVSLGLSASTEMDRDLTLHAWCLLFPIKFSSWALAKECETCDRRREWEWSFVEETNLFRIALFASLRARSISMWGNKIRVILFCLWNWCDVTVWVCWKNST